MKRLILLAVMLLTTLGTSAQNYYPGNDGEIKRDGYTYRYHFNMIGKILFNADNKFVGKPRIYKGSEDVPPGIKFFTNISVTQAELQALVLNQLSDEYRKEFAGKQFTPIMSIDAQTGRVADVVFILVNGDSNYRNRLPVEVYRKIELALKEHVVFTTTEECSHLNFFIYPVMAVL